MSRVIAVCNQKGGVGKSTTAVNVCAYAALSGKRTLLVDLDPQGNATTACGIARNELLADIYDVLVNEADASSAVVQTAVEHLSVLPSDLDLAGAEQSLSNRESRETLLRELCDGLRPTYELILLDCPPSLGLLTVNALVAADSTLIPVQCEYLALEGLSALMWSVDLVRQRLNPSLAMGGIVLTMTDFRANLSREVAEEVRRFFKGKVFETTIPRNVRLAECPSFGKPIALYDPSSSGALAYKLLTDELMAREGIILPAHEGAMRT